MRLELVGLGGKRIVAELRYDWRLIYPGSGEEPPDYDVRSRLYVNDVPVDPLQHPRLVRRLEKS